MGCSDRSLIGWGSWRAITFAAAELHWSDLGEAFLLGLVTLLRVIVLMVLASLIWVPIGVWLGLRPAWARRAQPVAQFLAAFPRTCFFPVFVVVIVHFQLNQDIWLTPLMVLGTQWYILFNVVAGAAAFPGDLREAASNFRVNGFLWWRKVIIPGYFVLHNRCHHCVWWLLERRDRSRSCFLGRHETRRAWPRCLHRGGDGTR
jgi:NitT/TauT family transport system permease protein